MTEDFDELDAHFGPRESTEAERNAKPPDPQVYAGVGTIHGAGGLSGKGHKPAERIVAFTTKKLGVGGEDWAKKRLANLGARLKKVPTYSYPSAGGWRTASTNVDFAGSMPVLVNGHKVSRGMICEAKGWAADRFPLDRISDKERGYFADGMDAGQLCILSLALWPRPCANYNPGGIGMGYLVTWQRWLEIEAELLRRSKGNYKGKSLPRRWLDLLQGCAVRRVSRRWTLEAGHWLSVMLKGAR